MGLLGLNTTPAERMRGCKFAESFFNSAKVLENGGTTAGSPPINQGITLDGSTQYVSYALAGSEFDSANLSYVAEFYPDFDPDLGSDSYICDASLGARHLILVNAAGSLVVYAGDTNAATVAKAAYENYWVVGGRNVIVFSGTSGNNKIWLNGELIADTVNAWTPDPPSAFFVGSRYTGVSTFDGRITKLRVYQSLLTEAEAIDLYQDDTYDYRSNVTLDLPCDDRFDNPTLHLAEDATLNENNATLGDGVTPALMPTKNSGRRGYTFDGSDDYLSGLTTPTGNFTVTVMKRVSGVVSITQENDLTTWNTLLSSGGFTGELLTLRVHPSILTATQLLDEQFMLKERLNIYGLPSGFISSMISEGALVLYHDYRSGRFYDWSENGNDGTPDAAITWNTRSINCSAGARVAVADSAELQLTEGSIAVLADFGVVSGTQFLVNKVDVGGLNYNFYLTSGPAQLNFADGGTTGTLAHDPNGDDYIAVNFASGEACEGFANGLSLGAFTGVNTITVDDAGVNIGSSYSGGSQFTSPLEAALIFNRKLTETEHRRAYSELYLDAWATEVTTRLVDDISNYIEPADPTNLLSLDMRVIAGKVPDLSAYGRTVSAATGGVVRSTQLGDAMNFDGAAEYLNCGTPYALNDVTVSMWIRPASVAGVTYPINYYLSATDSWGLRVSSGSLGIYDDIDNAGAVRYSASIVVGQWYHVVAIMDSLENKLYVNGELVGSGESSSDDWSSFAGTLYAGAYRSDFGFSNSDIAQVQLFSEAKSAAWVAEQYAYGAESVQGKTDWAAQESIANETGAGNFLSNTPFQIGSGTWKVSTDTIDGQLCKVIECVSDGFIYVPTTKFDGSPTADAYGSWDWYFYKTASGSVRLVPIGINPVAWDSATQNGYVCYWGGTERVVCRVLTAGPSTNLFYTANDWLLADQWAHFRITRTAGGSFTGYVNGQLVTPLEFGTNPATDNTHTTSAYQVVDMTAGCKFAYADLDGDHSLIKQLGVSAP